MNPKWPSSRLLTLRRTSCPTVFTELTATQKRQRANDKQDQTTFAITAKTDFAAKSSIHTSELRQTSKVQRRYSSDDGLTLACLSKLQSRQIPNSVHSTFGFNASKSTTSIDEELYNRHGLEEPGLHQEKNEAEIIGDFPVNQRRVSLPAISSCDRFHSGAVVSSAVFITGYDKGQGKRKYGTLASSVDRELQCLYKNSKEDKRLMQTFNRLDKQSFVDNQGFRQRIDKIVNEYQKLVQISPTVDEWFATRRPLTHADTRRRGYSIEDSSRTYSRNMNNSGGL